MIQRIQSVWLLLAAVLILLTLKLSFFTGVQLPNNLYHELKGTENLGLLLTTVILSVLVLFIIFLFKKRTVQLQLIILAIVLELLLIYLYYHEVLQFTQGAYSISASLHVVVLIAFVLAANGIRKDNKLVKNSDRLR